MRGLRQTRAFLRNIPWLWRQRWQLAEGGAFFFAWGRDEECLKQELQSALQEMDAA